ncbi:MULTISPECIES: hypothetical protein [Legionella]|uniref:Transmembrane protein n=2 Tax=Legionella TaxID=445 RepID=A0A0W1AM67_9GAMM|nr:MULTISPECIES: hypothetical protein [Legionella]KTD82431.1 hypothetical protein Lwal_0908 [Legionella waltersii]RJT43693.1 hypothetical protein D6J04_13680 [Legionella taurinensis]SNU95716.1 Uncharacterised protein [Legionella waltersii]
MDIGLNHSILVIAGIIFTIGIVVLILANGSSGRTMRRMGFIVSGFALIAFIIFFFIDVVPMNT